MSRFVQSVRRFGTASTTVPKKTALFDYHVAQGGSMVDFCGWNLPIKYKQSLIESHLHTRSKVSLFDVSHMGQVRVFGADRGEFLESLLVGDIKGLQHQEARLSLMLNEQGGIIDDLIVTANDKYYGVVVNAGCADKDIDWMQKHAATFRASGKDVTIETLPEQSLVALQGPEAANVLQKLVDGFDLKLLPFMHSRTVPVAGVKEGVWITRCGYTGEDGFEISVPSDKIVHVVEQIVGDQSLVKLAGLGARDSLRLEAGLCLYGNDIDESITPIEAALGWTIAKRRKEEGGFIGADRVLAQLQDPSLVEKKRVGFTVTSGAPARQHAKIFIPGTNEEVGEITSGTFSPSLGKPVAMGYINHKKTGGTKSGIELEADVRGRRSGIVIAKTPFVPAHYYKL